MKKITLILVFSFLVSGLVFSQAMSKKDSLKAKKNAPFIMLEKSLHDFGTIQFNGDGTFDFKFKNTGKTPLIISNCQTSCGCTVPEWPKDPIPRNGTASIKVKYATNRAGVFQKTVTIISNSSNSPLVLTIKGNVEKQKENKTSPERDETIPGLIKQD